MDSKNNKIGTIFGLLMLSTYLRSIKATNIDCNAKPFHCINSTHFMICVDLGAGVSKTVDDFVIQCPPTTVCRANNIFECEYQMPTTTQMSIRPADEMNDFTTDITAFSKSITNPISSNQKIRVIGLFDAYNTVNVSAKEEYVSNIQNIKQKEITGNLEEFPNTNANTTVDDLTEVFQATTEPFVVPSPNNNDSMNILTPLKKEKITRENISSFSTKSNEAVSELPFAVNTLKNITNTSDVLNIIVSNIDISTVKPMDILPDRIIEMVENSTSTLSDEKLTITGISKENDTFIGHGSKVAQTENSEMGKKYNSSNINATHTTLMNLNLIVADSPKFENNSPKIKNVSTVPKLNLVEQSIQESVTKESAIRYFPVVNITQVKQFETSAKNTPEILNNTEKIDLNISLSRVNNKIELASELNLTEQMSQTKERNTLSPYEQYTLDTTEKNNFTTWASTSLSAVMPTEPMEDTRQIFTPPAVRVTSTLVDPIALEYQVTDDFTPKSIIEINTYFDYKLTSENITTEVNLFSKDIHDIVKNTIATPQTNDNDTSMSNDNLLEVTSTMPLGNFIPKHTSSIINFQQTTPDSNVLQQTVLENKINISPSYEQSMTEATVLRDISSTKVHIPDVSSNTFYLTNENFTPPLPATLEPKVKSIELTSNKELKTTLSNNAVTEKTILRYENTNNFYPELDLTSTLDNSSYYVSHIEDITAPKINNTSMLNNDIPKTLPELNTLTQNLEVMTTESFPKFHYTTEEYNKPTQKENITQIFPTIVTEDPYINDYIFESNLQKQTINDIKVSTSLPYTTKGISSDVNTLNLSISVETTTLSSLFTNQLKVKEQVKDKKDKIETSTAPYNNVNIKETFLDVAANLKSFNSTLFEYQVSDVKQLTIKEITSTFENTISTIKPDIEKANENKKNENTDHLITNVTFINENNKLDMKQHNEETISTTPWQFFLGNERNDFLEANKSISTKPQVLSVSTPNIIGLKFSPDGLIKGDESASNNINSNSTFLMQNTQDISNGIIVSNISIEHAILPTNNTPETNLINKHSIRDQISLFELTTLMPKPSESVNDDNTFINTNKLIQEDKNKSNYLTDGIDYMDQITSSTKIDSLSENKYVTEIPVQNQQTVNDTIRLASPAPIPTESSLWDGYYLLNTNELFTNEVTTASTLKQTTPVSKKDESNNKIISGENTNIYFNVTEESLSDMIVNSESTTSESNFIYKSNIDQETHNYIDRGTFTTNAIVPDQKIVDEIINTEVDKKIFVNDGMVPTKVANIIFVENANISPNKSLSTLENIHNIETSVTDNTLLENTQNSTGAYLGAVEAIISSKEATSVNITNKLLNKELNVSSENFSFSYTNNSIKSNYTKNNSEKIGTMNSISVEIPPGEQSISPKNNITHKAASINVTNNLRNKQVNCTNNDSDIVVGTPMSTISNNLIQITEENTSNNADMKNNVQQSNRTNDDHISSKRSALESTEIPLNDTSLKTVKPNTVQIQDYIHDNKSITINNKALESITPFNIYGILNTTKDIVTSPQTSIRSENISVFVESRLNNITYGHKTTVPIAHKETKVHLNTPLPKNVSLKPDTDQVNTKLRVKNAIVNINSGINITRTPIRQLGSVTVKPYQKISPISFGKQAQIYIKLNKTLKSTGDKIHKPETFLDPKKRENLPTRRNVTSIGKEGIINNIKNRMEMDLKNNRNFSMRINGSFASSLFPCNNGLRGRFPDKNDCRKYYICIGNNMSILGQCPINTVFSEIKKQCTKNLSHCIRNNQFRCIQEGRFSDVLRSNIYYICVNNNKSYVRFQFQCQNGFHLNKTSVRCVNDIKYNIQNSSTSLDADSNKGSDQSTIEHKSKEKKKVNDGEKYLCKREGKFPDAEDCRRYYVCTRNSKLVFRRRTKKCDSDEVFHRGKEKCVDSDSYECN